MTLSILALIAVFFFSILSVVCPADAPAGFKILPGLVSSFGWTIRYKSRPAAGTKSTNNLYLMTLGSSFESSQKR